MDLTLHVLLDPARVAAGRIESFAAAVKAGGATVIQLRGKTASGRELVEYGRRLRQACRRHGLGLIVNDRVDVALAISADGVHLGQDDMPVAVARRLAPHLVVGLSVGSLAELPSAWADRPDYFGIGPVYRTSSKADAGEALGLAGFSAIQRAARESGPVVAIGGIDRHNVAPLWELGVDGVAVISAVVGAADWTQACRDLRAGRPE